MNFVDLITIYTKQSTALAANNSEMVVIGWALKWYQLCVCPLIDHVSKANQKLDNTLVFI